MPLIAALVIALGSFPAEPRPQEPGSPDLGWLSAEVFAPQHPAAAADEIHWTLMGQNAVTLDWRGTGNVVRYGLTSAYGTSVFANLAVPAPVSSAGPFWEARLSGLAENTLYHYSIDNGPDHTFRTPPPRGGSDFTVYVEGDIGASTSYWRVAVVQSQIAADLPRFVLGVGDLTYGNDRGPTAVDQHFNDVMVWSQDAAYMPCWGNHDWDPPDSLDNYKGRFDLPNPRGSPGSPTGGREDWYWFDYGNVRFIAYPEPWAGAWSDWGPRATALMDSAQADPAIRFVVTFGHRPAYSSGHHSGSGSLRTILDALGATHPKYVLNLNGHSHDYERSTPQSGVTHVTAGGGGSTLEWETDSCLWAGGCPAPEWSAFRAMHHGPVRLQFSDSRIEGTAICGPAGGDASNHNDVTCALGSVMDAFTITPSGTGPNLVGNPSFETGTSGWSPYHGSTLARVAGGFHGSFASRATSPNPSTDTNFGVNDSPSWVALNPHAGYVYRSEAWVRSDANTGSAFLQVREYRNALQVGPTRLSAAVTLSPAWQMLRVDLTSGADSSSLDFQVVAQPQSAGAAFDLDSVSIRVVGGVTAGRDPGASPSTLAARFVPNPMSGTGTVSFELHRAVAVAVDILDLQGRRVRTLQQGLALQPGSHALRFDGRGDDGARLRPGVFFYRLYAGTDVASGRFLILN